MNTRWECKKKSKFSMNNLVLLSSTDSNLTIFQKIFTSEYLCWNREKYDLKFLNIKNLIILNFTNSKSHFVQETTKNCLEKVALTFLK